MEALADKVHGFQQLAVVLVVCIVIIIIIVIEC